ncbi:MAG: hypothetical protein KDB22_04660 [Planctomycetales bacterium]|nr:hypothetical protein [Planctomycetales bacterium]
MKSVTKFLSGLLESSWENTEWVMNTMDLTQWGIVAVVFVVCGFLLLKTRL